jgi:hypothetical protein
MASSLDALPPELLSIIATFCVEVDDENEDPLLRLRSTSRTVQAGTRHAWLYQYFSERDIALTPAKLNQVNEVTSNSEFARIVTAISMFCKDDKERFNSGGNDLATAAEDVTLDRVLGDALRGLPNL